MSAQEARSPSVSRRMDVDESEPLPPTAAGTQPLEDSSADAAYTDPAAGSRPNSPDAQDTMRTRRSTRKVPEEEDEDQTYSEDAEHDGSGGDEGDPLHRAVPSRSRSLRARKQSNSNQTVNPRLANLRSRAEWKAAAPHQQPTLADPPSEQPAAASLSGPTATSDLLPPENASTMDDSQGGRRSPTSPRGTLHAVGLPVPSELPPSAAGAPPELPAPIPPHSYAFIPQLPQPLQSPPAPSPEYGQPPAVGAAAARAAPRPIAPRAAHPAATSPPTSSASPVRQLNPGGAGTSRPHVCPLCTLAFARAHDLKRHSTTHTGEKKFKCPSCGKAYGRKDALKRHACAAGAAHAAATAMYQQAAAIVNGGGLEPVTGMQEEGAPVLVTLPGQFAPGPSTAGMLAGRSRGQLQAPPIVGAAATMLGNRGAPVAAIPMAPDDGEEEGEGEEDGEDGSAENEGSAENGKVDKQAAQARSQASSASLEDTEDPTT